MTLERRRVFAWCLFDWANSPYTTLVVTFVYSAYFAQSFAPNVVTTAVCVLATGALTFVGPRGGNALLALALFVLAGLVQPQQHCGRCWRIPVRFRG